MTPVPSSAAVMAAHQAPTATLAWTGAPFEPALAEELRSLLARLDDRQRLWLGGYIAGSLAKNSSLAVPQIEAGASSEPARVTILYGSHSGNTELLAKQLGEALAGGGLSFQILDMMDCRKNHLQETSNVLVLVSTHGEGDPPERAIALHELLHGRKAPRLDHVSYSVLALGDSSYEQFCETGRQFDSRMEALGAKRLYQRIECDVDFGEPAQRWIDGVVQALVRANPNAGTSASTAAHANRPGATQGATLTPGVGSAIANAYTRKNPFLAPVLLNQQLTARHSTKDVRHIELSLEGSNIHYEPGDSLGIVPRNQEQDVDALLAALDFPPQHPLEVGGAEIPLRQALLEHYDIGLLSRPFIERYAAAVPVPSLKRWLEAASEGGDQKGVGTDLQQFLRGRHLIDLVREHPPQGLDAADFSRLLRPLAPRLYSIASSLLATPDEAHLTVSIVKYRSLGQERQGVVSGWLAARDDEGNAPVYLQRNPAFHLPASSDAALIMIGPGTGVAPFRGFLAEREATGARGRNWLFFGDRTFQADFLYQTDWLQWRKRGLLDRIDVSFSREGNKKSYVQHRMLEQGQALFAWLNEGAHVYVCGDAQAMAPDVDRALHQIVQQHGGLSDEQSADYIRELQRQRRYQKDVY